MESATIEFRFESSDKEKRFLREYLADAWERFEANDFFKTGWFWRFSQFPDYDAVPNGLVLLTFDGEPDSLVKAEKERWENFDGLDSWEQHLYEDSDTWKWGFGNEHDSILEEQKARKGEIGGEWQ